MVNGGILSSAHINGGRDQTNNNVAFVGENTCMTSQRGLRAVWLCAINNYSHRARRVLALITGGVECVCPGFVSDNKCVSSKAHCSLSVV